MVALILWLTLGARAAAAEAFVELALGLVLYVGTGAGTSRALRGALAARRGRDGRHARRAGSS